MSKRKPTAVAVTEEEVLQTASPEEIKEATRVAMEKSKSLFSLDKFRWDVATVSVGQLLQDMAKGSLVVPDFQRMYVWNNTMLKTFLDSIQHNIPCGCINLGEVEGVRYLVDGMQRNTSFSMLLGDEKLLKKAMASDEDILQYQVVVTTVRNMTMDDLAEWFRRTNSGVKLAAAVKARSILPKELRECLLHLGKSDVLRDERTSPVFARNHHHEIIAAHALLAAAGMEIGENRPRAVSRRLLDNQEIVLEHQATAGEIVNRLAEIFSKVSDRYFGKIFTSNYIVPLLYIMAQHPEIETWKYQVLTDTVFVNGAAIGSVRGNYAKRRRRYRSVSQSSKTSAWYAAG